MYPRLAHIGPIVIPTYGVIAALGLVCSILFAEWCARKVKVSGDAVWNLCLNTALATLLLSRLILIAQSPSSFRAYPWLILSLPTVTRFGLLIVLASAAAILFLQRLPLLRTLDALGPAALLLATFLHLGSFFAGTDLGSGTRLSIGNIVKGDEGHHPVALYAALFTLLGTAVATATLLHEQQSGQAFGASLTAASLARFFADEFRPGYLLPETHIPGFLRIDQIALILLTAAGVLIFLKRGNSTENLHA